MKKYLVISGPSGVGKSTILREVLKHPQFRFSTSYTTRARRPQETDGTDYHFVSKREFEEKLQEGFFLEYTVFSGN